MRVLITSLREKSHFMPLVPFIEALRRTGHTVGVATPADLAERVAATGAEFLPFDHPGDDGLRPLWARMRGASVDEMKRIFLCEIFAGVCASVALPGLLRTAERWRPDVLLRESFEFAAVIAGEKTGIPQMRVAIISQRAEDEMLTGVRPALDAHRAAWNLELDPEGKRLQREPALTLFPAGFEDRVQPPELRSRFRVARPPAEPLPDWWAGRDGAFVYASLGTVAGKVEEAHAGYRGFVAALGALPVRALLTIGPDLPLELLGDVAPNIHVERFVPQDQVLPHAAVVVNHGGSGSVLGALAAGVPQVIVPMFADQPYNAAQLQACGAGVGLPESGVTAEQIKSAVERVLSEPHFAAGAARVASEIAALPSLDEVGDVVAGLIRS